MPAKTMTCIRCGCAGQLKRNRCFACGQAQVDVAAMLATYEEEFVYLLGQGLTAHIAHCRALTFSGLLHEGELQKARAAADPDLMEALYG